jgi:hypothetical protein
MNEWGIGLSEDRLGEKMPITLPIDTAGLDLKGLLEKLKLGDTVTLVGSEGVPQALLVSL